MGIAAAAMATAMFAGEPAANVNVAEFNGNATVKWGVNLDTNKTGFKNETWTKIKLNLFDQGNKATTGDDIWGELVIKVDPDYNPAAALVGENADAATLQAGKAIVDVAKIHFGEKFYVGIKSGDTQVGELKVVRALNGDAALLGNVGANYTQGIVAGYSDNNFGLDVDFRSNPDATSQYTDDYGMAAEATLKGSNEFVADLEAKAGVTYEFTDDAKIAYAVSAGYKIAVNDEYYLKPVVGYTASNKDESKIAASLVFGWGNQGWGNPGVYFIDGDMNKTPGISVDYVNNLEDDADLGKIYAAFYLGDKVENLKAAADMNVTLIKDADTAITAKAGCAYDIKSDDITVTPKAGISFANEAAGKSILVKAGVDLNGLIDNTTLGVEYVSGNLQADPTVKGTVDVFAKIHF